jgi:hypothetical protein
VSSRLAPVRERARRAKLAIAVGGLAVFGAAVPLARLHYSGHSKQRARPLDAPEDFRRTVNDDLLRAGILAPATAPDEAVTALS